MNKYRKLPDKYEEPLSNLMYYFVRNASNKIKNTFSPNEITTFNIILRIIRIIMFNNEQYVYLPSLIIFSTFFDIPQENMISVQLLEIY